uniref:DOMON domain-containing protein n=1 Tax=Timema bartmani TaxID=61472 RepID=A0A7R9F3E4_9NEOP|nr:unnamed protein product [Timema bartmani]
MVEVSKESIHGLLGAVCNQVKRPQSVYACKGYTETLGAQVRRGRWVISTQDTRTTPPSQGHRDLNQWSRLSPATAKNISFGVKIIRSHGPSHIVRCREKDFRHQIWTLFTAHSPHLLSKITHAGHTLVRLAAICEERLLPCLGSTQHFCGSKLNCEVLWDDLALEVRWAVAGDSVVMQLVSKLEDGEYMSFGLSGDDSRSRMIGGDVVVAWVDKDTLKGYAQDYFLDSKSQCAGTRGSCPDNRLRDNTNSVRLLNAAMVNGYSIVTYQRPLVSQDELDRTVLTNGSQAVIWAVGPLNSRNECYTHRYLGWRINVLDACDSSDAASEPVPARVPSGGRHDPFEDAEELESSPSILVETRVRPNGLYSGGKTAVVSPKNRVDVEFLKQSSEGYSQRYEDYTVRFADNTFLPLPAIQDDAFLSPPAIQDDALLPPPAIQKEPPRYAHGETAPQDSSKVQNTVSPDSKESSATIKTTELPSSSSTEGPTIRVTSELPTTTSSKPLSLITVDPKRKPIVHATTPYSLLQLESKGESQEQRTLLDYDKTSGLVQESQQSTVVIDGNQLNSSDQPKLPAGLFRVASKRPAPLNPLHVTGVPYPHSTIPQSHVGPLYPQMMFQRPPHHYTMPPIRRPYPQRAYSRPLQGGVHRPPFMPPGVKFNPKKPFYRVPIMGGPHHPVMVTPQFHHPMGYHHMPGHSPVPLKYHQYQHQQQQGSNKFYQLIAPNSQKVQVQKAPPSTSTPTTTTATPTTTTTTLAPASSTTHEPEVVTLATISPAPSSDANSSTDLPVAVNTGFHPDSVIVEGGFKPIIHQKAVAEDRSSLGEPPVNDPEDEVVSGTKEERKDNPFEGQKSELFEPMFIPSPPDRIIGNQTVVKKPGALSEDLTPPAVIQGKPSRPYDVSGRTHPDMRRPLYPNKKTSNFHHPPRGVDFRHQQSRDETPMAEERMDAYYHNSRRGVFEDETPMAAERMETYYLPPQYSAPRRAPIPPGAIVTYDGKPVVDGSLSSPPNAPSAPHRGGSLALVRGTPQFGPFLGEVPPPVPDVVRPESIPQLRNQKPSRLTPEDFGEEFPDPPSLRSTQLSPLDEGETPLDILLPDGTELKEEVVLFKDAKSKKQAPKKTGFVGETPGNDGGTHEYPQSTDVNSSSESDVVERTSETADQKHPPRRRRSAHHEPGHEEDHSGHDHGAHNQQSSPNHSSSISSNISLTKLLTLGLLSMAILKFLQGVILEK